MSLASQDGCAHLYQVVNRDQFRFDTTQNTWFTFKDPHWEEDHLKEAFAEGIERVKDLYIRVYNELQASGTEGVEAHLKVLNKKIAALTNLSYKKSVLELAACGADGLGIDTAVWDSHPHLVCCGNGVVDLRTGQLLPSTSDLYLRRHTSINYPLKPLIPTKFLRFLESIFKMTKAPPKPEDFEDVELYKLALTQHEKLSAEYTKQIIDFIQRLMGYVLWGAVTEHVLLVFHGIGRNGKTVLVELIKYVIENYAGPVQAEILLTKRGGAQSGPSPELIDLRGLRFVWASETNEGNQMDGAKVKLIVGGDTIVGRNLYAKSFTRFKPSHTLFLLTNFRPNASADDFALWERIILVPFKIRFVNDPDPGNSAEGKIDRNILESLKTEAPEILRWMIEGYQKYKVEGLALPLAIQMETAEYRKDMDVLGHFIDYACVLGEDHEFYSHAGNLYNRYKDWTEMWGHMPCSMRVFGERMKLRFRNKRDGGGMRYFGIRLKKDNE